MTPVESPHVLLTRAADRIEERAAAAGVWPRELKIPKAMLEGTAKHWGRDPEDMVNEILWIITVPPAVAPHLVAWLRDAARRYEANPHLGSNSRKAAFAFALTVLGMEAETP